MVTPPKTLGAKALVRGIVFSTAAVAAGDTICQKYVASNLFVSLDVTWIGGMLMCVAPHLTHAYTYKHPLHRIEDPDKWDQARTLRMATATACIMAPTSWAIVMRLERLFPGNAPRAIVAKTVANGMYMCMYVWRC